METKAKFKVIFSEETFVITTHAFIKKTQKTHLKEIAKAESIRKEYFKSKNQEQ